MLTRLSFHNGCLHLLRKILCNWTSLHTFFDFAQKGASHGFIAHGGEIKGPAAEQASKKAAIMEGATVKKQVWKNNDFLYCYNFLI